MNGHEEYERLVRERAATLRSHLLTGRGRLGAAADAGLLSGPDAEGLWFAAVAEHQARAELRGATPRLAGKGLSCWLSYQRGGER